jgi:hypothetical protein
VARRTRYSATTGQSYRFGGNGNTTKERPAATFLGCCARAGLSWRRQIVEVLHGGIVDYGSELSSDRGDPSARCYRQYRGAEEEEGGSVSLIQHAQTSTPGVNSRCACTNLPIKRNVRVSSAGRGATVCLAK